jgi:hypothetical protein
VLFEYRTCFLLDFFDGHILMLHSFCGENNAIHFELGRRLILPSNRYKSADAHSNAYHSDGCSPKPSPLGRMT